MNEIEQKEIEEMARVMAECEKTCDECFAEYEKLFTQPIQNRGNHCQAIEYCTKLYNAGYRNCKDEMVCRDKDIVKNLKREIEFWKCRSDQKNQILERFAKRESDRLSISRKETAREILTLVKQKSWCYQEDEDEKPWTYSITVTQLKEIAKQYGVEVE
jgi:hypothetical protein